LKDNPSMDHREAGVMVLWHSRRSPPKGVRKGVPPRHHSVPSIRHSADRRGEGRGSESAPYRTAWSG
jgi:hypothetical protein